MNIYYVLYMQPPPPLLWLTILCDVSDLPSVLVQAHVISPHTRLHVIAHPALSESHHQHLAHVGAVVIQASATDVCDLTSADGILQHIRSVMASPWWPKQPVGRWMFVHPHAMFTPAARGLLNGTAAFHQELVMHPTSGRIDLSTSLFDVAGAPTPVTEQRSARPSSFTLTNATMHASTRDVMARTGMSAAVQFMQHVRPWLFLQQSGPYVMSAAYLQLTHEWAQMHDRVRAHIMAGDNNNVEKWRNDQHFTDFCRDFSFVRSQQPGCRDDQYTVMISAYDTRRAPVLFTLMAQYMALDDVAQVIVVWHDPSDNGRDGMRVIQAQMSAFPGADKLLFFQQSVRFCAYTCTCVFTTKVTTILKITRLTRSITGSCRMTRLHAKQCLYATTTSKSVCSQLFARASFHACHSTLTSSCTRRSRPGCSTGGKLSDSSHATIIW